MEAKDTVMSDYELEIVIRDRRDQLEYQAEISFRAGYAKGYDEAQDIVLEMGDKDVQERAHKAGRKEVVEWIRQNTFDLSLLSSAAANGLGFDADEWQAKLREWEIDD